MLTSRKPQTKVCNLPLKSIFIEFQQPTGIQTTRLSEMPTKEKAKLNLMQISRCISNVSSQPSKPKAQQQIIVKKA